MAPSNDFVFDNQALVQILWPGGEAVEINLTARRLKKAAPETPAIARQR